MDLNSVCQTPQAQLTLSAELRNVIHERNILTTRTRMKVLSALDDINKVSTEDKQNSLREKAIQEILTSEVSYLRQLELLMKHFMKPLKEVSFVSHATYSTLFGHIETLYKVNGELLYELKLNSKNIGAAFYKLAPFFKLYSVYAYDYKQVLTVLQDIKKSNPELNNFICNQENHPEVGMKLSSLLITPIQRVPRYRLLLKEVLSLTSSSHADYTILQDSLHEVERTADHINNLVQDQENIQKIIELQRSLSNSQPNIIAPGRRLIKEGILMKVSPHGKKAHPRYFILFNDLLMYCKMLRPTVSLPNSLRCCCVLPLRKCHVVEILSKGMFKLTCHNETLLLYSTAIEEGEEWITTLREAVKQYHECRQTLRKDSSSRRPLRRPDFTSECEMLNRVKTYGKRRLINTNADETSCSSICENAARKTTKTTTCFSQSGKRKLCLQDCPRKLMKLGTESIPNTSNIAYQQNSTSDPKDSLYPLRDSMGKKRMTRALVERDLHKFGNANHINLGVNVTDIQHTSSDETQSPDIDRSFQRHTWHLKGFHAVCRFVVGFGRSIRKHVLRQVPHVPAFE